MKDYSIKKLATHHAYSLGLLKREDFITFGIAEEMFIRGFKSGSRKQKLDDATDIRDLRRQRDEYYDELTKLRKQRATFINKVRKWCNNNLQDEKLFDAWKNFHEFMSEK